jgi:hypothetical protein
VGDVEPRAPALEESPLKYHPVNPEILTSVPYRDQEQCLAGSLTGAVASQRVTEAREGYLRPDGNRPSSVRVEGSLTERSTDRTDTKVGPSDPVVPHGRAIAQRIKGTPGITG